MYQEIITPVAKYQPIGIKLIIVGLVVLGLGQCVRYQFRSFEEKSKIAGFPICSGAKDFVLSGGSSEMITLQNNCWSGEINTPSYGNPLKIYTQPFPESAEYSIACSGDAKMIVSRPQDGVSPDCKLPVRYKSNTLPTFTMKVGAYEEKRKNSR